VALFTTKFGFPFGGESGADPRFARVLLKLLPRGRLLKLEEGSWLRRVLDAIGDAFDAVDTRRADLLEETDPRTATETLPEWERMLSLPDDQLTEIPATDAERRVACTQKLVRRGGQSYAYFESVCAACGWPLESIDLFSELVLRAGFRVSDRVYGDAYAYTMQLNLLAPTASAISEAAFERVIRKVTHTHISLIFNYA
jgi:uncharacterized protein YmfQ (DUF2313 family)